MKLGSALLYNAVSLRKYLPWDLNPRSPRYERGALNQTKLERHMVAGVGFEPTTSRL